MNFLIRNIFILIFFLFTLLILVNINLNSNLNKEQNLILIDGEILKNNLNQICTNQFALPTFYIQPKTTYNIFTDRTRVCLNNSLINELNCFETKCNFEANTKLIKEINIKEIRYECNLKINNNIFNLSC